MKCLIRTLWLDRTVYDYFPPCCLVPSKTTLTVAIASETRDVICMWRLWMDEHEMRWVYASRGSVLTWQREARLSVQQVQEGSCSMKAIRPECRDTQCTNRLLPIAETNAVWGCMKTHWCNCKVKTVDHWLSALQQHVSELVNYLEQSWLSGLFKFKDRLRQKNNISWEELSKHNAIQHKGF